MWVIPPLLPGASRADREWHRREVAVTERELKDVWTNACLVTHLAQVMPPPGAILQSPTVASITLDSVPACFTVKLRPGQLPGDFARRAERFATAFRVPAVEIVPLTRDNQWISVRLMEPYWIEWPDEYVLEPAPVAEPQPALPGVANHDDRGPDVRATGLRPDRHPATNRLDAGTEPIPEAQPTTAPGTFFRFLGAFLRYLGDFWRLPDPRVAPRREPLPGTEPELTA